MSIAIIAAIILLATVPALIFKKKFNIEIQGPICLWKTKRTLNIIEKLSKRKKLWSTLADLGIVFSFGLLGAGFIALDREKEIKKTILYYLLFSIAALGLVINPSMMVNSTLSGAVTLATGLGGFAFLALFQQSINILTNLLANQTALPGVAPVIPGVDVPGSPLHVPIYAVIGLILLLIVHEWGHGIAARAEEIAVKSVGLVTLGIFPIGAFTEPDEEELKETTRRKRTRVYSIGSMMNLVTAFAFAVVLLLPLSMFVVPNLQQQSLDNIKHLEVTGVAETSPLKGNIEPGTKIYNVEEVYSVKPEEEVILDTSKGEMKATANKYGQVGLNVNEKQKGTLGLWYWTQKYFTGIINWIVILNFLIGVINYLPFAIFDGARIIKDISGFYADRIGLNPGKTGKAVSYSLSIGVTVLLVINVLPYFVG